MHQRAEWLSSMLHHRRLLQRSFGRIQRVVCGRAPTTNLIRSEPVEKGWKPGQAANDWAGVVVGVPWRRYEHPDRAGIQGPRHGHRRIAHYHRQARFDLASSNMRS